VNVTDDDEDALARSLKRVDRSLNVISALVMASAAFAVSYFSFRATERALGFADEWAHWVALPFFACVFLYYYREFGHD
jgi:hypothetical protein